MVFMFANSNLNNIHHTKGLSLRREMILKRRRTTFIQFVFYNFYTCPLPAKDLGPYAGILEMSVYSAKGKCITFIDNRLVMKEL